MLDVHAFLMNAATECFSACCYPDREFGEMFDWDQWIELMIPHVNRVNEVTNSDFDPSVVVLYIWACFSVSRGVNADASFVCGHKRKE